MTARAPKYEPPMPMTTNTCVRARKAAAVSSISSKSFSVIWSGKSSQPKKSLPGQVPARNAL